jgi:hypothetical protein
MHQPSLVFPVNDEHNASATNCSSSEKNTEESNYTLQVDGSTGTAVPGQEQNGGTSRRQRKKNYGKPCFNWSIEILIALLLFGPIVLMIRSGIHTNITMDWVSTSVVAGFFFIIICQLLLFLMIGGW